MSDKIGKLNKITVILNTICTEMGWQRWWGQVSKFVEDNQDRVIRLYDLIVEVVEK